MPENKNIFFSYLLILSILFPYLSPTIILPFTYKNKKFSENLNTKLFFFESMLDNTIYTTMKVYNKDIDFHISMERYPMYISDSLYKKYLENNKDSKKESLKLYSLDQIGINRASLINRTIIVKTNSSLEKEIKEINIFRTRKFLNVSEYTKNKMGYASEEAEIGFNIIRGSQYQYVEETENDIDTEKIKKDYEEDKKREEIYDDIYGLKNKSKNDSTVGYDPLNEYNPDYDEDKKSDAYSEEELEEIYGDSYKTNNKSNNNKNENNKNDNKERFMGSGLFKEEYTNFISQLKQKDKINTFTFSIKYNNDDNGEIIIGDLPHEYSPDKYSLNNYFFDTVSITKEPPFNWHFTYKKCNYGEEEIDQSNIVKLSIDFGFIKGNKQLKNFLEKKFFSVNLCYKDQVKGFDVYYCEKEAIKNFKPIILELSSKYCSSDMNARFEFNSQDLFIKNKYDDLYYFQIVFDSNGLYNDWILGKPLFKKYQMVFNQDRKTYGFYVQPFNKLNKNNNIENNNKETSLKISWVIVFFLIIISLGLLYAIHKLIARLPRKLKANELEENFSYDSNNSKYSEITSSDDKKKELYENA